MYHLLILISVVMFGICFRLTKAYRNICNDGFFITLRYLFISSLASSVLLFIINGFKFEFTLFSFIIAVFTSINSFLFSFCSIKALGSINLSLYSLFSMLGGMLLPFLQGIIFYGEKLNFSKILCLIFITASLLLTIKKDGKKHKGTIYYAGIFIFNGMSGVLSKIFSSAAFEKTSATGYSLLSVLCSFIFSGIFILIFRKSIPELPAKANVINVLDASINRIANLLLLIALLHVDASVQYPMVTGGVMIVSTIISYFDNNKPSKRELISVLLAFISMLCLFIIP